MGWILREQITSLNDIWMYVFNFAYSFFPMYSLIESHWSKGKSPQTKLNGRYEVWLGMSPSISGLLGITPMQSVPITTDIVSSNPDQGEVYNIMW